jgi:hypothetical protein
VRRKGGHVPECGDAADANRNVRVIIEPAAPKPMTQAE